MFNKSLTIVLPVHNAELRLRKNVGELLELASELTAKFGVLIIDDGSTDATPEIAAELAAHYPQVSVRRNQQCRGLGATIDYVNRRVRSDAVILHDGVTPINSQQMRQLWHSWVDQSKSQGTAPEAAKNRSQQSLDIAALQGLHRAMEESHRPVVGFQLMTTTSNSESMLDEKLRVRETARGDSRHISRGHGLGQIPSLPRPKFLAALAEFAFGE